MHWKVLISAPYFQPVVSQYADVFSRHDIEPVLPSVRERLSEEQLLAVIEDVDGVISGDDEFTAKVLHAGKKLKVISKWGTGIDSIDQETCQKLGVSVRNTPNAFSVPVADTVIGYMLCFARKLPWMDRNMKEGVWDKIPGRALQECNLGVIGVGDVGKTVVRRALAFGMRVLGNDIVEMPKGFLRDTKVPMVSLEDVLGEADFLSLNCDLNPTSYHLMNESRFAMMKSTAVVINTSRGPVIDEGALIQALQNRRIAGAALDVFEVEPLPEDSPLRHMDNVLLAPHNANSSPEAWERVHQNTIKNLLEELQRNRR